MLINIKDILRKMGDAFSFAHAGEMLSFEQKSEILSQREKPYPMPVDVKLPKVVFASDEDFSLESLERAISLCQEESAILDLLCVSGEGENSNLNLATVLPRLGSEANLDFKVTRRQGNILSVVDGYLRAEHDTLMVMVNINDHIRERARQYHRLRKRSESEKLPAIELVDGVLHV